MTLTPEQRQELVDFHVTFRETEEGRRVYESMRKNLDEPLSAYMSTPRGLVLLDDRQTVANEGRRAAFAWIKGQLDAYDRIALAGAKK